MKYIIIIIAFITVSVVAYGQHPPPKTPKDPDADMMAEPSRDTSSVNGLYKQVEREPQFPGGIQKLYAYLRKNLRYPQAARENNVQGKVFVTFVVEKDGSLTGVKVLKSLSPETDAEAIRLMQASPKWNPGIQNNRAVRVQYTFPVVFSLEN